ncbi:MAG: sodium-translocating pyrophosphatase, partial [Thermoplasmatales archaeon]|nr:sodium-translocating pyrophosphatase [Thermoplasmatales archaeon]
KSEYKVLVIFVAVVASLLGMASFFEDSNIHWGSSVAFIIGAIFSAVAGNIGMRVATMANARTAEGTKKSIGKGLSIAFSSGAVMGMCVVGLGVLGVFSLYILFHNLLSLTPALTTNILFGFGFGASSIALFARVGGGIYTKSADVGADLVGKVEAGIPEDDPRNPAVIADQVGDNVGDVAGMGADLFESYVDSIIATMALAAVAGGFAVTTYGDKAIILPLVIAGMGIFASIIGTLVVIMGKGKNIYGTLRNSLFISTAITAVFAGAATWYILDGEMSPFFAMIAGLVAGIIIGLSTEYYTSEKRKPAQSIADASKTGPATVIIQGMTTGMLSTVIPIIAVVIAMLVAHHFADFYGVAISAVGMLSILGVSLATDCYGPVADNAQGISEMAGMGTEVRERTEQLDAIGNTTAAMGKGFAIGSAAITSLALLFTYMIAANELLIPAGKTLELSLGDPKVISGVFIGAMLPFVFTALTMGAVGRAAYAMVEEVRYQFKKFDLLNNDKNKPDYARCVKISTNRSLKEMIFPSLLAVVSPVIIGLILGPEGLGGLLVGSIATGFLLAVYLANAGGAWDNAKKYIESGNLGGKGSDAHKATIIGDTVGDPCKDTSGPSLNILIKLMSIVSLVFLPLIIVFSG